MPAIATSFEGALSGPMLVLYLTCYFIIERLARSGYRRFFPVFYAQMYQDRKDIAYFAFLLGIVLNMFATPMCLAAFWHTTAANDVLGRPNLSSEGQICIASKAVLWVSELNRLDHSTGYVLHHLSSITYLLYHLETQFPLQPIYAMFSALATELFSNTACLATYHGLEPTTSPWTFRLQTTSTVLLLALRLPSIVYAATFLPTYASSNPRFWLNIACLCIYARFIIRNIMAASARLKLVQIDLQQPARLQIGQRLNVSVYAIFFGIASFTTALLAAYLFEVNSPSAMSDAEINRLGLHLVGAGASGLVGARLPVFSHLGAFHELLRLQKLTRCGLWLQGSISAVALSVLYLPVATDRYRLLLSLVLAFPLGEALGRVGCHFAGCCMTGHRPEKITTPLQSALFNSAIGAMLLALHLTHRVPLLPAAALALALNALVRLALRPNVFAAAQLLLGLVSIGHSILRNAAIVSRPQSIINSAGHPGEHAMLSLQLPWVAVLAFASLLSGVFVQMCSENSPRVNITMGGDAAMKASSSVPALESAQSSPISRARESLSCPGESVELVDSGGKQPR
ncbi:hypothetical protein BP6252_08698 [Coleophoma cylindrospora]|uniref:Uncharacterized protein n=1 Tax=Coleophoma cylindrospora TaxID=1849047 RepID=A0A3D8R6U0_9HELO|nr:hypothetical protein BP6252_08698 [Coleophoma cylindrospora]